MWVHLVDALARCALARLCRCFAGPACQSLSPPSTARSRGPRARTPRSLRPRCLPAPNRHPDPLLKSPHTPTSPLTHPSCAHLFFKLAEASPSPGLLRPNPPPAERDHRPQPCFATVKHSLAIVLAPPKVNFPVGPLFLPPLFSLFHRLAAGDRRYRYRAVVPRPPDQLQPPHALFSRVESPALAMALASCARPRKTAVLTRRTRPSASPLSTFVPLVWSLTGGP
jgi:hypothetical protein